jgi:hypothetical protein
MAQDNIRMHNAVHNDWDDTVTVLPSNRSWSWTQLQGATRTIRFFASMTAESVPSWLGKQDTVSMAVGVQSPSGGEYVRVIEWDWTWTAPDVVIARGARERTFEGYLDLGVSESAGLLYTYPSSGQEGLDVTNMLWSCYTTR